MSDAIQRIREALAWSARAFGDHSDDIRALLDRLDAAVREIERLRHDIERHIAIASEHATECERLRAELAECSAVIEAARCMRHWHDAPNEGMVVSGSHVRELWKALNNYDAARKGEGE